ncbi:MAG: helix-turn-helix domain-containing protein [Oscillospiraceae bacterium]|nr:helix-turn-helix domain-containing protein [Oscillospiraceae bacterium]
MTNKLYQNFTFQMQKALGKTVGIIDESATIIACSDMSRLALTNSFLTPASLENTEVFQLEGYTYKSFIDGPDLKYAVFVEGEEPSDEQLVAALAVSIAELKHYYDEKFDRNNFIKNVVLDNVLPGDIFIKARELHFNTDVSRVVFFIKIHSINDISAVDVIQNLFPDKQKDFVFTISENDIVLIKEIKEGIEPRDLEKLAHSIVDTLSGEFYTKSLIGIGSIVVGVKDLAFSFKEAQLALEVGKVFDTETPIVNYSNLGIARLIYQLPTTLCSTFLREVFKKGSIESLDHETMFTIQKFFENSLNVSETSRKLFVHRNTLVYRLEKIKKLTGLDLREFDHAIVFKIAMMVQKYLSANEARRI